MSDVNEDENNDSIETPPKMKERHKQFFEERFSVIKPKSKTKAAPGVASDSNDSDPKSTVKESFRQDLMKKYRSSQKHTDENG